MIRTTSNASRARSQDGCGSRVVLTIFGLVFIGAGFAFCGVAVRTGWQEIAERSWSAVPCTILSSDVGDAGRSDRRYAWHVRYTYAYNGVRYTSDHYAQDYSSSSDYADALRLQLQFPAHSQATCFVNPEKPSDAVLRHRGYGYLLMIPFGLVFAGFGLLPLLGAWSKRAESKAVVRGSGPISDQGVQSRTGPAFLFVIFALFGGLVLWLAFLRPFWRSQEAIRSWRQVPCTIVSSHVTSHRGNKDRSYTPDILYRYEIDGREYRSNRYSFFGGASSRPNGAANIVRRFPRGLQTRCYVDPRDSTQAVLQPQNAVNWLWAAIPGLFFVIGVVGLVAAATGRLSRNPSLDVTSQKVRASRVSDPGRPITLKPRARPITLLLCLTIFALFWNSIVSVFVWQASQEWHKGRTPIFLSLFLVPFVLVGLGFVAAIGYYLLALFNPRIALTLSRGAIETGGGADVQWSFGGRVDRIQRLTMTLEGREEATYRSGEDVKTDKSVFATIELLDTTRPSEIRSGRKRLQIPADTAPTFHAVHNKVLWVLVIRGDIPRWPDVKEEFEIEVIPTSTAAPAPLTPGIAGSDDADSPLSISIDGGRTAFAPLETSRGTAYWNLDAVPKSLELRLFCFTRGAGITDARIIERVAIPASSNQGSHAFQFRFPAGPPSFSGRLVSLVWAIELIAEPGNRSQRIELIVAPGGKAIELYDPSSHRARH